MTRRSGSVESAVGALAAAFAGEIKPPKGVRLRVGTADRRIWTAVIRARARDEWSEIDKHHAANLVRCLTDIERISCELVTEGDVVSNQRGTQIVNPKHSLLEVLSRRAVALTRLLHLHAGALIDGHLDDLPQRRQDEKDAREAAAAMGSKPSEDDDLLARPPARLQ